jgi:hypothetical protein
MKKSKNWYFGPFFAYSRINIALIDKSATMKFRILIIQLMLELVMIPTKILIAGKAKKLYLMKKSGLGCDQINVKIKLQTKSSTTSYTIFKGCIEITNRRFGDKPNIGCTDITVDVSLYTQAAVYMLQN